MAPDSTTMKNKHTYQIEITANPEFGRSKDGPQQASPNCGIVSVANGQEAGSVAN